MKRFWRRKNEDDNIIEGEVEELQDDDHARFAPPSAESPTLERVAPDIPTPEEAKLSTVVRPADETDTPMPRRARRLRLPRLPRLIDWNEINPGLALLTTGLIAGGVFWTLANLGATSPALDTWWPGALLGLAALWGLQALLTRQAAQFLAASALIGASVSLLLHTHDLMLWRETFVGSMLIAIGLGVIVRGLVLRQGSMA
ncbi:MAG: hypothetical protein ACLFTK_11540 [Anaerolineales bacterium]